MSVTNNNNSHQHAFKWYNPLVTFAQDKIPLMELSILIILPDPSNTSHLVIIRLLLYSNLHILPVEATRGHHCSPLPHVGNFIPELMGTAETEIMKRK